MVRHAIGQGWKVGCHAEGDAAVRRVLDAYEQAGQQHPGLAPRRLIIEHAFLADADARGRAVRANAGITVQPDLMQCPVDDLPSLSPVLTLAGGRPVHDPDGRVAPGVRS